MSIDIIRIRQTEQTLRSWSMVSGFPNKPLSVREITAIRESILIIAKETKDQYPIISDELDKLRQRLFCSNASGVLLINSCVLGQTVEALSILNKELTYSKDDMWSLIHPAICKCSRKLFEDGSYINSTVDAFIEINDRVKHLYRILKPSEAVVPDGRDLMNKAFGGNTPLIPICELETERGKDVHVGTYFMLSGAISALRNPKSHTNKEQISRDEAVRRLMLASMLMYRIDEAVLLSNIVE